MPIPKLLGKFVYHLFLKLLFNLTNLLSTGFDYLKLMSYLLAKKSVMFFLVVNLIYSLKMRSLIVRSEKILV